MALPSLFHLRRKGLADETGDVGLKAGGLLNESA